MRIRTCLALAVLLSLAFTRSRAVEPTPPQKTIDKALTFLVSDALAWRKEKQCATCHHGVMTVWAASEARAGGYSVSADTLKDLGAWTKTRLKNLDKPRDTRVGWNMVNTPALYLETMAQAFPAQDIISAEERQQIYGHLLRHQETDGQWAWSIAPPQNRAPPHFESDAVATMLGQLALQAFDPADAQERSAAYNGRVRAADWLMRTKPTDTTQAAALRLLVMVRSGASAQKLEPAIQDLLGRQNKDGGWGQLRELPSDAYATGQALYFLSLAGVKPERNEVQRGVAFLVGSQKENGAWPMKSRAQVGAKPASNPVPITYFGASWATLGLVRSVSR